MKKYFVLSALIALTMSGCQRRDTHELRERIIKLENKVAELDEKIGQGVVTNPEEARKRQLESLISAFTKLEEKSYADEPKAKAGEGSIEVIVTNREGPAYMQARTAPQDAEGIEGVTIRVTETNLPTVKTKSKGPVRVGFLKAGNYTVEFEKAGYQTKLFPVEIREGKKKTLVTFLLKDGEEIGQNTGNVLSNLGAGGSGEASAGGGVSQDQVKDFMNKLQEAAKRAQPQGGGQ